MTTKDDIAELLGAFSKAIENQDAEGVASFFSSNARFLPPDAPMIEGRAGVETFAQQMFAAGMRTLALETVDVLEGGDLIAEVGRFTMGFDPETTSVGKYITVYRRQPDGSLIIEADTFNGDVPAT